MATSTRYTVRYRRKREGKTDYKQRLSLLKSGKPRLVVRPSIKNVQVQIIEYQEKGDRIIVSAHSGELAKLGWKYNKGNMSSAYLVGYLLGKKAITKGLKAAILDLGQKSSVKGTKNFAILRGVVDSGLIVPHSKDILPSEDRVKGEHISAYAKTLQADKSKYEKQFSKYIKDGLNPENISKDFEDVKKKISA